MRGGAPNKYLQTLDIIISTKSVCFILEISYGKERKLKGVGENTKREGRYESH